MAKKSSKNINIMVEKVKCKSGGCGMGYCLGVIGAAVYFAQTAVGFWGFVLAILKAIVWPAFAVFGLLKFLGM